MSVTEAQRHQLFEAAKSVFGEANAETFMNLQPTVDPNALVTKSDLRVAVAELKSDLHHTIWISQGAFAAFVSAVFTIVTVFG
jgi:hypothetical protein